MVLERSYTTGKRTLAYHVKNHIIGFTVFGEICLRVINDLVCPNRAQHVQFPCAVHGSHFSSEVPGKLYRKRPDTSTGTMNQDLFSTLDMSFSQQMHCFKSPNRKGGCFLIGHIGRFDGQHPVFRQACVLSIRTQTKTGPSKHLVPLPKSCDLVADCLNFSGELLSQDHVSWSDETQIDS